MARRGLTLDKDLSCLWPAPYDVLTPEAAYRFLTECWWTDNEANQTVELIPQKEYVRHYCDEWVNAYVNKTPMWTEKVRRIVISWASRGLETWVMGLARGSWMIVDQTDKSAGEHLWRVHYCLTNLYDRRPELNLRPHEVRGAVAVHNVSDIILPNGSWLTQSHQEAAASQGKGKSGTTLEELSKYQYPSAFVGQAITLALGTGGKIGGWVNGICNPSPNPDWHQIKANGKDVSGKPTHVKAAELLQDPQSLLMQGFAATTLTNGQRYLAIGFEADEDKRTSLLTTLKPQLPPREWERDYMLSEDVYEGKPVYETYVDDVHSPKRFRGADRFPAVSQAWYVAGWDCGNTLRPGFAMLRITPQFQVQLILEVESQGSEPMSIFAPRVMKEIQRVLPGAWPDVIHVGDGTVRNRQGNIGKSAADIAKPHLGSLIKPMNNHIQAGASAVSDLLMSQMKTPDGGTAPRFVIDGGACPVIRAGFNGAYKFGTVKLSDGSTMYTPEPLKNRFADPHDALKQAAQEAWRIIEGKSNGKISRRNPTG